MNVIVTGAAGFIGSNFVHYLRKERPDWRIVAVDKLTYAGNLENLADLESDEGLKFERVDICDEEAIAVLFEKEQPELVFHLAAESHVDRSIMSSREFVLTNVNGTQVLLDAARKNGVRRFVHISTDEVYGSLEAEGRFVETTPLDPTSPYAASKAASDLLVLSYAKTHKMDCVITRCTNNYGPYQFPEKFIPLFTSNVMEGKKLPLYGDGSNVRSWIYVDDHSSALLAVAEKGKLGEVYNIGGPRESELPNKRVAELIIESLDGSKDLLELVSDRPAHDFRYAVDTAKIESELGWKPTVMFEEGLAKTVKWYQDNRDWWKRIKSGAYREYYEQNYSER